MPIACSGDVANIRWIGSTASVVGNVENAYPPYCSLCISYGTTGSKENLS